MEGPLDKFVNKRKKSDTQDKESNEEKDKNLKEKSQ